MNERIRVPQIRLIGAEGEALGIVATAQALEMAREAGLDLVEVADREKPPVCKIMDYGKFKYAQSKKAHQKTHQQKLKEIRVRPKTGDHDIQTKIVQARQFLEHNDKVQVNVLFRGREMQHIEEGQRAERAETSQAQAPGSRWATDFRRGPRAGRCAGCCQAARAAEGVTPFPTKGSPRSRLRQPQAFEN
ncbi:MAG TPA: translation initiation factor IF-3 [Gemmata sp.]